MVRGSAVQPKFLPAGRPEAQISLYMTTRMAMLGFGCASAQPTGSIRPQLNNLPGFKIPFGSNTVFTPRINAISAALRVLSR